MNKIKILLVDDHAVVRKGLISLLEDETTLDLVGDVSSGREALEFVKNNKVDLVLLDLNMPEMSGMETAKHLSKLNPKVKKLVFSMHNDPDYVLKSIENGVDGYLLKDSEKEEIVKAIEEVFNGQKYFPTAISAILVGALQTKKVSSKPAGSVLDLLSKKELEILRLVAEGMSSQDIAEKLDLSVRTVSNHRANMLRKTNINNTTELVGILKSEEK
ncbi:MAG TPA: response regulator transcription factor [Leadbetterella sp.]|nr:response regulator transcription factor [Leadbetterella sp.]